MARMSIDDMVQRDPRITKLANLLGWSRRETMGALVLDVWPICYDQREHTVAAELIDIAAARVGFASAMVDSGLAEWTRGNAKVRIRGARERIEYLDHKKRAGRVGGLKSAQSRNKISSTASTSAQAAGNPSASASVPDPASASVSPPAPVLDQNKTPIPPRGVGSGSKPRSRKPKPSEPTEAERSTAMAVLKRLGERNGTNYTGTDKHVRLIANQLRAGVTELELRAVVGYCAVKLGWLEKPAMADYLRPETLFGPDTIQRYLDPARTWARDELEEARKRREQLVLVPEAS